MPLFNRDGRTLSLNPNGKFLYENVCRSLAILDSAIASMTNRTRVKEIHICINSGDLFMEEAIAEYRMTHDDVFFVLGSEYHVSTPRDLTHYDLAVYTSPQSGGAPLSPHQHCLLTERFGLCVPDTDPVFHQSAVSLPEMAGRNFLATDTYGLNYQLCREAGFSPKLIIVGQQLHAYMKMLEYGAGVSIAPEFSIGHYLPPNCRFIPIEGMTKERTLIIEESMPQAADSHIHEFVGFCVEKARTIAGSPAAKAPAP